MRFPLPSIRCDSPNSHPALNERIPILIDLNDIPDSCPALSGSGDRGGMRFRRWKDRPRRHEHRHALSRAYQQGYLDSLLASPPIKPKKSSAISPSLKSFASDHPYTTLASIGAAGTLAFLGSSYLAHRAFRYMVPLSRLSPGAEGDMERRLVGHISAANRDRRTELERFRRELMGTLEMIAMPGPKIMGSGSGGTGTVGSAGKGMGKTVTSPVSPKEAILGATPRKFDAASLKAVAPIAAGMDEARLAQVLRGAVEDVLHARGTVQEEDLRVAMRKVLDERFGSRNGTVPLGNQQGNADASAYQNDSVNEYEVGKEYENHDVYSAESLQVELDTIRSELDELSFRVEGLEGEANEGYGEDSYDPTEDGTLPVGTDADLVRAELETAAQVRDRGREAMQNGKKDEVMPAPKGAKKDVRDEVIVQESPARPVKSEQTQPKSDVNEASFSPQTEARKVAAYLRAAQARHMIKSGRVDAVTAALPTPTAAAKREIEKSKLEEIIEQIPAEQPVERLGVDDSGAWSFYLVPFPRSYTAPAAAGWRLATIVCSRTQGRTGRGRGYNYSSEQSFLDTHTNQKVFYYPEFDIVRVDGSLWRCSPEQGGCGGYRIRERMDTGMEPQWNEE